MKTFFWSASLLFAMALTASGQKEPSKNPEHDAPMVAAIPQAKGTHLEKDWLAEERTWAARTLLKPAQERWQGKPWADEAVALVEKALDLRAQTSLCEAKLGSLAEDFRRLLKSAPDDPTLLLLGAEALHAEHLDWRASRPLLETLLNQSDLPVIMRVLTLRNQIPQLMTQGAEYRYVRGTLVDLLIQTVTDKSYLPEDAAVFVRHQMAALDMVGVTMPSYLTRWQEAVAGSEWPEWVKETLLGYGDIELAWLERSDDWAYKVKDAQWEGFSRYLTSARKHLQKAWELKPDRPEAAARMITVTMGESEGPGELRQWFDRAVSAQFDYAKAYNNLLWALRPRWMGSHEEMLAFGQACAATARYDTGVPSQLFFAAMDIASELDRPFDVYRSDAVKPYLRPVVEGYLNEKDLPMHVRQIRVSNAALMAWLIDEPVLAQRALAEVGPRLHFCTLEFMKVLKLPEARLRGEVAAGAGRMGDGVRELLSLSKNTATDDRQKLLDRLSADGALSREAKDFVQEEQQRDQLLKDLATGEWVTLVPGQHLTRFIQVGGGRWSVEDGAFVASGDDARSSSLLLQLPFSEDLEVTSDVAFLNPTKAELSPQGCGFGHLLRWQPKTLEQTADGVRFMTLLDFSGRVQAQVEGALPEHNSGGAPLELKPVNSWKMRLSSQDVAWAIDDRVIAERCTLDSLQVENTRGMFGFAVQRLPVGAQVRFQNIRLRKLTAAAGPLVKAPEPQAAAPAPVPAPPEEKKVDAAPMPVVVSESPPEERRGSSRLPPIIFGVLVVVALLVHSVTKKRE